MTILLSKQLISERNRQARLLPEEAASCNGGGIFLLTYEDVLDAHFSIVDFFDRQGYGIGGVGIKDVNTFVSTVERQHAGFGGFNVYDTDFQRIATLMYGIIKNHPFHDGNKRTAFLCALLQLHRLGRTITVTEKEFENLMVDIADDQILKKSALKQLVKKRINHPEIVFLGRYLEKHSRKNARLNKTIKFRQLRTIIEKNGFEFRNAHKGTIDLVHVTTRRVPRFWFSDQIEKNVSVLATIAYHGEGVDVPDNTVKLVRQKCGLTDQDGFDGEVLLRNAQPTFQLIEGYRSALQRLAFR